MNIHKNLKTEDACKAGEVFENEVVQKGIENLENLIYKYHPYGCTDEEFEKMAKEIYFFMNDPAERIEACFKAFATDEAVGYEGLCRLMKDHIESLPIEACFKALATDEVVEYIEYAVENYMYYVDNFMMKMLEQGIDGDGDCLRHARVNLPWSEASQVEVAIRLTGII